MNRRSLLTGLIAAPLVVRTPGLIMPVRSWHTGIRGEIRWVLGPRVGSQHYYPAVPLISDGRRWLPFWDTERRPAWAGLIQPPSPAPVDGPVAICA